MRYRLSGWGCAVLLGWACASLQIVGAPTDEERAAAIKNRGTRVDTSAVGDGCAAGADGKQCAYSLVHERFEPSNR